MGFELMDLLQSTVFKTDIKTATGHGLEPIFLSETFSFERLCRLHSIRPQHLVSELIFTLPTAFCRPNNLPLFQQKRCT